MSKSSEYIWNMPISYPSTSSSVYGNNNWWNATTSTINISKVVGKYLVFNLPIERMPIKVFVNGLMLSLGMLGSDVDVAYTGKNKLVFSPNTLPAFGNKTSVAIEYIDEIYHYTIDPNNIVKGESTTVDYKLVSNIKIK